MSFMVTDKGGKDFNPAPAGLHRAVCVDVVDLGMIAGNYGPKHMLRLVWQIEEIDPSNGKPFLVLKRYGVSLNEKAILRKDLESWRARQFSADELKGFDLERLLGVNCQLNVLHQSKNDKTYANVTAVLPPSKGPKLVPRDYIRVKDRQPQPVNGQGASREPGEDDVEETTSASAF